MGILQRLVAYFQIDALDKFPCLHILKGSDGISVDCSGLSGLCLCVFGDELVRRGHSVEHSGALYRSCQLAVSERVDFLESAVRLQIEIIVDGVLVRSVLALRVHLDELVGSGSGIIPCGRNIDIEPVLFGILRRLGAYNLQEVELDVCYLVGS